MHTPYHIGESWYELNQLFDEGAGTYSDLAMWYQDAWGALDPGNDPDQWEQWGPMAFYNSYMPMPYDPNEIYYAEESSNIQKDLLQNQFLQGDVKDIQDLAGLSGLAVSGVGAHTDLYGDLESSYADIDLSQEEVLYDLYSTWGEDWLDQLGVLGELGAFDEGTYANIDWEMIAEDVDPLTNFEQTYDYYSCMNQQTNEYIDNGFGVESQNMALNTCNDLFGFSSSDLIDTGDG